MKKGLLFFHQGWTDLVNQLSMIDYSLSKCDHITVILRPESKPIIEFYLKNKDNITKIYDPFANNTKVSKDF